MTRSVRKVQHRDELWPQNEYPGPKLLGIRLGVRPWLWKLWSVFTWVIIAYVALWFIYTAGRFFGILIFEGPASVGRVIDDDSSSLLLVLFGFLAVHSVMHRVPFLRRFDVARLKRHERGVYYVISTIPLIPLLMFVFFMSEMPVSARFLILFAAFILLDFTAVPMARPLSRRMIHQRRMARALSKRAT